MSRPFRSYPLGISELSKQYQSTELAPAEVIAEIYERIERYPDPAVWIEKISLAESLAQLAASTQRKSAGIAQPLWGIPFAIKDNIDLANHPTTAGCPAFAYRAERSARAVQRLCDVGAIVVGKTNLDQFATGLVGTRSPYGACRNTFDEKYISGGSSSGSAVAVSAGLVSFALGTDTAGSGRVPAAFNNLVGLKPTRGAISTSGVVPACRSLDCVSIFALSCSDAANVLRIAEGVDSSDPYSRDLAALPQAKAWASPFRFGVPAAAHLDFFGNADAGKLFHEAVARMTQLGGVAVEIDFAPFEKAAALLYNGPWLAERTFAAKKLLATNPDALFAVTRKIIGAGSGFTAADTFAAFYELELLRHAAAEQWNRMDVLLLPTAGTIYTIEAVNADPIQLNTNLGRYTNFVNLLDLCAVAVPAGFQSNGLPFGVTVMAPAGADGPVLALADRLHRAADTGSGVDRTPLSPETPPIEKPPARARLAVLGAHLSGLPLNWQLTDRGATLVQSTRTAPMYRLYALPNTTPAKPGMIRVSTGGVAIELEVWEMSRESFADFVTAIPTPLGVGSIQLADGSSVQGFLCEQFALEGAADISAFGGWRAYVQSQR